MQGHLAAQEPAFPFVASYRLAKERRYSVTNLKDGIIGSEKRQLGNRRLIGTMLSKLSPGDRFILLSREIEGLSFKEIALITGGKSDEIGKRCQRIKDELRKYLD
jgi:DNA-directed RNA polymerase specialized sigma24 family protein